MRYSFRIGSNSSSNLGNKSRGEECRRGRGREEAYLGTSGNSAKRPVVGGTQAGDGKLAFAYLSLFCRSQLLLGKVLEAQTLFCEGIGGGGG